MLEGQEVRGSTLNQRIIESFIFDLEGFKRNEQIDSLCVHAFAQVSEAIRILKSTLRYSAKKEIGD